MAASPALETLIGGINARRQEEDALRAAFSDALEIATDLAAVNAIVSVTRPDLVITETVPQRQIETYPFDPRRVGNFIPRLGGFGELRYANRSEWPGEEPKKTLIGRYPVTNLDFDTYLHLAARGGPKDYLTFAEREGIDPEMALDAFHNSLTRYGAFARMALIAPILTKTILRSCVKQSAQPRDVEIYTAYSLASILVDKNDYGIQGPDDNQVLSR